MADQNEVHTFLDGNADPFPGYISFERFEDPIFGLEKMSGYSKMTGRAASDSRRGLEITTEIEEIGRFLIKYDRSNPLLEAFDRELPVIIDLRKRELDGGMKMEMTFKPR